MQEDSLRKLHDADRLHKKIVSMSSSYFKDGSIGDTESFRKSAELMLSGVRAADSVIAIFNHSTFSHVIAVGEDEFWGELPEARNSEKITQIMSLLEKDYTSFFTDSVEWFTAVLDQIPREHAKNIEIYHCGIRYRLLNDKPVCLFSKGLPIHYDSQGKFSYTFNYVQNIDHLLKKDFRHYWIRISYGEHSEFVRTFHSDGKVHSTKDLLSAREKEILKLVANDCDTKEIADRLFISSVTVGNHRSNMIARMGARDTTALVQLAKMANII
jgi:DNA-binding CsgD family transcriptional regulator